MKKNKRTAPRAKFNKKTPRRRKISAVRLDPKTICDLDQVYCAINQVQIRREKVTFLVPKKDATIVDNILNDIALIFNKKERKSGKILCIEYKVSPVPEATVEQNFDAFEDFSDELLEDGQIFFG